METPGQERRGGAGTRGAQDRRAQDRVGRMARTLKSNVDKARKTSCFLVDHKLFEYKECEPK